MTAHNPLVGFGAEDKTCAVIDRAYRRPLGKLFLHKTYAVESQNDIRRVGTDCEWHAGLAVGSAAEAHDSGSPLP